MGDVVRAAEWRDEGGEQEGGRFDGHDETQILQDKMNRFS